MDLEYTSASGLYDAESSTSLYTKVTSSLGATDESSYEIGLTMGNRTQCESTWKTFKLSDGSYYAKNDYTPPNKYRNSGNKYLCIRVKKLSGTVTSWFNLGSL
jgi:hypothetical protein